MARAEDRLQYRRWLRPGVGIVTLWVLCSAAAIYPLWAVKYPPLLDYPNHLASSYVLAHLRDTSLPFHQWYGAEWGPYPYIAMDAVLHVLQFFAPIELAGRVYLSLTILGLPLATWFFLRQANPGQDSMVLWALVGTHNIFFLLAYLSFFTSLTFCFLALGLWLQWLARPRVFGWSLALLAFTAVYFSHLVTFAVTGLAVTAYCLLSRPPIRKWLLTWALFVPGACCYLYSARVIEKQATGIVFHGVWEKLDSLRWIAHGYSNRLDNITLFALAVYFVAAWLRNPEFRWSARWLGVGVILFAAYWGMPWAYGDGSDLDVRVLPVLFGVIFAFARVGRRGWWLAPVVLVLFFARVENITQHYRAAQPELVGLAGSFSVTPMNARVLPIVSADPDSDVLEHPFAHFWAYGVIRRHWFSPYLFELRGLEPLRVVQQSYTLDGFWDLDYRKETPDWRAIQEDYDYVWCYDTPQYSDGLGKIGQLAYESGKLKVYKVNPRAAAGP